MRIHQLELSNSPEYSNNETPSLKHAIADVSAAAVDFWKIALKTLAIELIKTHGAIVLAIVIGFQLLIVSIAISSFQVLNGVIMLALTRIFSSLPHDVSQALSGGILFLLYAAGLALGFRRFKALVLPNTREGVKGI